MSKITLPVFLEETEGGFNLLQQYFSRSQSRIFVVADTNTAIHCLPWLERQLPLEKSFIIKAGEEFKTLETCITLWNDFLESGIDRSDCVIGLGGGCVSDLTGFACSIFKRGIPFVFMPTTLLGMVDAALGGKNGVDFSLLKNMLGTINEPQTIFIRQEFLSTLPERELRSGYAEMLKHALIANADLWKQLPDAFPLQTGRALLEQSAQIKLDIVTADIYEKGGRKMLNYGHTVGHALESWYLHKQAPVLHGEAVAAGMCVEALLSRHCGLPEPESMAVVTRIRQIFGNTLPLVPDAAELLPFMLNDKKNAGGELRFSLLAEIGEGLHDISIHPDQVAAAIDKYRAL